MTTESERKSEKTHALDSDGEYSKCGFMVEDVEVVHAIDNRTLSMLDCTPCAIRSLLDHERVIFERDVRELAAGGDIASATLELVRRAGGPQSLWKYARGRV
jgi:hypothetical protein